MITFFSVFTPDFLSKRCTCERETGSRTRQRERNSWFRGSNRHNISTTRRKEADGRQEFGIWRQQYDDEQQCECFGYLISPVFEWIRQKISCQIGFHATLSLVQLCKRSVSHRFVAMWYTGWLWRQLGWNWMRIDGLCSWLFPLLFRNVYLEVLVVRCLEGLSEWRRWRQLLTVTWIHPWISESGERFETVNSVCLPNALIIPSTQHTHTLITFCPFLHLYANLTAQKLWVVCVYSSHPPLRIAEKKRLSVNKEILTFFALIVVSYLCRCC